MQPPWFCVITAVSRAGHLQACTLHHVLLLQPHLLEALLQAAARDAVASPTCDWDDVRRRHPALRQLPAVLAMEPALFQQVSGRLLSPCCCAGISDESYFCCYTTCTPHVTSLTQHEGPPADQVQQPSLLLCTTQCMHPYAMHAMLCICPCRAARCCMAGWHAAGTHASGRCCPTSVQQLGTSWQHQSTALTHSRWFPSSRQNSTRRATCSCQSHSAVQRSGCCSLHSCSRCWSCCNRRPQQAHCGSCKSGCHA